MTRRIMRPLVGLALTALATASWSQDITFETELETHVFSLMDVTDRFVIPPGEEIPPLDVFESVCAATPEFQEDNVCRFDDSADSTSAWSFVDLGQQVNDGQVTGNHSTFASSEAAWDGTKFTIHQVHRDHDVIPTTTTIYDADVAARLRATATATIQVTNAIQGYIVTIGDLQVDDRIDSQPYEPEDIVYIPGIAGPPNPFQHVTRSFVGPQVFFPGDSGTLTVTIDSNIVREFAGGFWVNDGGNVVSVIDDFDFARDVELPIEIQPLTYEALAASPDFWLMDSNTAGVKLFSYRFFVSDFTFSQGSRAFLYDGSDYIELGLRDAEHVGSEGAVVHVPRTGGLNEAGQAIGESARFLGGAYVGYDAWLYDGTNTIKIGLYDAEHVANDGYRRNFVDRLSEAGRVIGTANRYSGLDDDYLGQSAWLYVGVETVEIGLDDAAHTFSYGFQYSEPDRIFDFGLVTGRSVRTPCDSCAVAAGGGGGPRPEDFDPWIYDGHLTLQTPFELFGKSDEDLFGTLASNTSGQSIGYEVTPEKLLAWFDDGTSVANVGLTDPDHTRADGFQFSSPYLLNDFGKVAGISQRFDGENANGFSAWFYDGATATKIGLYNALHTSTGGLQYSVPTQIFDFGHVVGKSLRNDGEWDFWYYNGTTTLMFGEDLGLLVDAVVVQNNAHGQSIGYADTPSRRTAWFQNGAAIVKIGLTDAEHTRADGYQESIPWFLNEAGQVVGTSERFDGATTAGRSAWFYNGATSVKIGIYPADSSAPRQLISVLNGAGQVTGVSINDDVGRNIAWFYDPIRNETIPLMLSQSTEGYAHSEALVYEDGLTLGVYAHFDGSELSGFRPFYFRLGDVPRDFGSLLGPDFEADLQLDFAFERIDGAIKIDALTKDGTPISVTITEPLPGAGDYNADGILDAADYSAWGGAFGTSTYPGAGADGNGDGQIDAADYVVWRRRLAEMAALTVTGDYNSDGTVDATDYVVWRNGLGTIYTTADYDLWRAHFGQTASSAAGASGPAGGDAAPEPGTFLLAVLALVSVTSQRAFRCETQSY